VPQRALAHKFSGAVGIWPGIYNITPEEAIAESLMARVDHSQPGNK
jgi:hypothetical protein